MGSRVEPGSRLDGAGSDHGEFGLGGSVDEEDIVRGEARCGGDGEQPTAEQVASRNGEGRHRRAIGSDQRSIAVDHTLIVRHMVL